MSFLRLIGFSVLVVFSSSVFATKVGPTGKSVPNEVLIKVRTTASAEDVTSLERLADAAGSQRLAKFESGTLLLLRSKSKTTEALTKALESNPNVEFVEPNYILELMAEPNDPSYSELWGLENTGQMISGTPGTAGADIDAEAAWSVTTGSSSIVVGVVDTGVDYTHPDLAANMWTNPGGKGNAACGAGTFGFNAITSTCDPMDDYGHGTHVAGTIGAVGNNGVGVAGVNWTTSIMALKFLSSSGYGTTANAVVAIDFAIQAKIDGVNVRILSNSWGGGPFSRALLDVINKANENDILFVASAGNSGSSNDIYPKYPSNYTTPNMVSVAATDNRDQLAGFSNWGPTTVHLAAPGVNVYSTLWGGGYGFNSGTSMAAPHVAGVAALVLAAFPSYTTTQVKSAILDGTDALPNLTGRCITGGRLNAASAVGGTPSPDFTILVNPATRTVTQGGMTSYTLTISAQNGFAGSVDLAVSGLPAGATASITPTTTSTTATLEVTTISSTPWNSSTLTITGSSGALTRTARATLSVVPPQQVSPCPSFYVGYGPYQNAPMAFAIGDLNGDGRFDYATADASLNAVVVRLAPSLSTGVTYPVGTAPLFLATGDFNGDGRVDLATANSLSHNVSVLLANGSGGFSAAVHHDAGTSPFGLATGDFNGDGKLDLAVANNGSSNVSILLGQGGGAFAPAMHYAAGSSPFWVTAADVDADGRMDLAVANHNGGTVSVLRGIGDGTFASPLNTTAGTKPSSVAAGDFNGDGRTDLAVSNYGSNNVSLLMGNGDGTFDPAVNFTVGTNPYSVAAGDLNGDGKLDLVTANGTSKDISILLANGFGSFENALNHYIGYELNQALIGDLYDDGKPDILVAAQGGQRIYYVFNGSSCGLNCGVLAAAVDSPAGGTPDSVAAGDFDGNGQIDLAIVDNASNHVAIHLGNGDSTFTAGAVAAAGSAPRGVAAADFNRDGRLDLAVGSTGSNEVAILIGNGDGTWQNAVAYAAGAFPRSVTVGDFNRDGKLDLAVAARDDNAVAILLGGGNGTFQAPLSYSVGTAPSSVAVGDFNRDGVSDLAVANASSANVSVLLGNADGTFQSAVNVGAGTAPRAVIAGDFNRDGRIDLATANAGSNDISFLAGIGTGTFQTAVNYATGMAPQALIAADLNGDGRLDFMTANNTSHDVSVLLAIASGGWGTATNRATGLNPVALASGDFNRDGKTDLVTTNGSAASLSLLLNTCPVPDLTVAKTHSGAFTQGGTGDYTITVSNIGLNGTTGLVTVNDTLPQGLAANAMTGTGWTCVVATATCTRGDVLVPGASYPPITLTVRVHGSAPLNLTNDVTVSGGGEVNALNDSASDPTSIVPTTDLLLIKTHAGSFAQGALGRAYSLVVRNAGGLASNGTVTVTDALPTGLAATAMSGTGWSCNFGSLTCTRADVLAGYGSYPAITLTVNVAADAPSLVTNTATVTGGGDGSPVNNTASDPTVVWSTNTCGSFGVSVSYSMGTAGMVVGDFNGDGRPDVATGSYSVVSVRLGVGDGTLLSAVDYGVPYYLRSLASGDLDHDGDLDLVATSDSNNQQVSVLAGQGDGTFATGVAYSAGATQSLSNVEIVDVDRDGNLDVLTFDSYYTSTPDRVLVLLGNGDGTLRAPLSTEVGMYSGPWTVSDVNGDSTVDVLFTYDDDLHVLLGNGDGTFQAAITSPLPGYVSSVTTGDFNGDGIRDVAAAAYDDVFLLLGVGNGSFGTGASFDATYSTSYITVADINADGKLDVITGGYTLSTLLGNGDGTLQPASSYTFYEDSYRVNVADFNGDGKADLAYTSYNGVRIRLGACPDLAITKTHYGNFTGGLAGTYIIRVTNVGGGAAGGGVTVTDTLPGGLTLNGYYAYGWNCTQGGQTLTCTQTGTLLPDSGHYWQIELNVNVSPSAPTSVTNVATLTAAVDTNPANNSASDPTTIVHVPDLKVSKSHNGTWTPGQTGTYTITVGNVGTANTSGEVTVTDSLPLGMSPVSMSGPGWTCGSLSCTRNDALAPTAVYPPISLTVTVLSGAYSDYNYANVFGGGETNTSNNYVNDFTRILTPPVSVIATAATPSQVTVTWSGYYDNPQPVYEVFRSSGSGSFLQVGSTLGTTFYDNAAVPNTIYLYKVRKVEGAVIGPFSVPDFAGTMAYTDDPVVAGSTLIKRVHIEQLRSVVNEIRNAVGLPATIFTDPSLAGMHIKKTHVTELRTALNEARLQIGLGWFSFSDSTLIKAQHINDLRTALK